jgi:hypothetical protein
VTANGTAATPAKGKNMPLANSVPHFVSGVMALPFKARLPNRRADSLVFETLLLRLARKTKWLR